MNSSIRLPSTDINYFYDRMQIITIDTHDARYYVHQIIVLFSVVSMKITVISLIGKTGFVFVVVRIGSG